jgi:hypothetical protein
MEKKEKMPLKHAEPFERFSAISYRKWETGTSRVLQFLDNDTDVHTPQGDMYLFHVKDGKDTFELWVKDKSAIGIGLAPFVPVKGRILKIVKQGKGIKDTRYVVTEVTTSSKT